MVLFPREYVLRRYGEVTYENGYPTNEGYTDYRLMMDIQTTDDSVSTDEDGSDAVQRIKVFCDSPIYVDNNNTGQRADRVWFMDKWFECKSSRLAQNTFLKHYLATFVECADQDDAPEGTGCFCL